MSSRSTISLLNNTVGFEKAVFGTDSALNGVANRGFNVGNLILGTGERAFNVFLDPQVPAGLWASLLTGAGQHVFNGGEIGGPVSAFEQCPAGGPDVRGLFTGN